MYSTVYSQGSPAALGALAATGAGAQRVIDLTESVAGRAVRGFVAVLGRARGALVTDECCGAAKPQAKRVFSAADA